MKIEAGKYYRTRSGTLFGPIGFVEHPTFMFCTANGGKSWTADGMFYNDGDLSPFDLVEECNADGSPIVVQSNPLTADRSWRDEIALRVLPSFVRENPKDSSYLDPNKTLGQEAIERAFYIADEFIKVSKQS